MLKILGQALDCHSSKLALYSSSAKIPLSPGTDWFDKNQFPPFDMLYTPSYCTLEASLLHASCKLYMAGGALIGAGWPLIGIPPPRVQG